MIKVGLFHSFIVNAIAVSFRVGICFELCACSHRSSLQLGSVHHIVPFHITTHASSCTPDRQTDRTDTSMSALTTLTAMQRHDQDASMIVCMFTTKAENREGIVLPCSASSTEYGSSLSCFSLCKSVVHGACAHMIKTRELQLTP